MIDAITATRRGFAQMLAALPFGAPRINNSMTVPQINLPRYGNIFINADTFGDLRAISTTVIATGYSAIVAGAAAPGDGFGGLLVWNPTSTTPDDNQTVIAPADGSTGRWLKIAVGVTGPQGIQGNPGNTGPVGAIGGNVMAIGPFQTAGGSNIPAGANLVRTSSYAIGSTGGHADYVYDPAVNTSYVAAHPRASFLSADGRGWRLQMDTITVEMFGAIGDNLTNDQPAIQATFDYAAAASIRHVQFAHSAYAVWNTLRTNLSYTASEDGIPLVIHSGMLVEPKGAYTTLNFLSHNGNPRVSDFQILTQPSGWVWRGGGIFIVGNANQPPAGTPLNIEHFHMRNMTLNGGCPSTGQHNNQPNASNSAGWDQTDKGFRLQDSIAGDFVLENVEITGFRGELLYGGGLNAARSMKTINCWIHGSDGDAYNWAGGGTLQDIGSKFGDAYQPVEIFSGPGSRFIGTEFYGCVAGGSLYGGPVGGVHNPDGSLLAGTTYAEAYRLDPKVMPYFDLDITERDCGGALQLSNWTRGRIALVDSMVALSCVARTSSNIELEIDAVCDQINMGPPFSIAGPTNLTTAFNGSNRNYTPPQNVKVVIRCSQSENAVTNSLSYQQPFVWDGIMGPNVHIILDDCVVHHCEGTSYTSNLSMPFIERRHVVYLSHNDQHNISVANQGADNTLRFTANLMGVSPTGATGDYPVTLDTVGYVDGQIVDVLWGGAGSSTMTFQKGHGAILAGTSLQVVNNQTTRFRFDASQQLWTFVSTVALNY